MRNRTVTYTKAIGIILMVLGHALCGTSIERFVSLFHMPLFFIMSGFCFKEKYLQDFKTFFTNKIKGIWKPFVIYGILFLFLHNIFINIGIYSLKTEPIYTSKDFVIKSFNVFLRMMTGEPMICTFWFLKSLFWGSLIFYFVRRFINRYIALPLLFVITIILRYMDIDDPVFHVNATDFMAASFIYIGCLAKGIKLDRTKKRMLEALSLIIMIVATFYFRSSMLTFSALDVLPYIITACSFCFILYKLVSNIKHSCLGEITGNNTLDIMIWHFSCFLIVSMGIGYIYDLPVNQYLVFPVIFFYSLKGWWVVYTIVGLVLPVSMKLIIATIKSRILNDKR